MNAGYYLYMHVAIDLPFECASVEAVPGNRLVVDYEADAKQIQFKNTGVLVWRADAGEPFEFMLDECDVAVWAFTQKDGGQ